MAGFILMAAVLAIAFLGWLMLRKTTRRSVIFEKSGLSYFKTLLRQRGVDTSRIPDAAIAEIIQVKIASAKKLAVTAGMSETNAGGRNWRINLVRSLEAEANLMVSLMVDGPEGKPNSDAAVVLTKYGIFEPAGSQAKGGMTAAQFLEASQRGTLYAELSKRQSKTAK